jgi:hypothetical protein
LVYFSKTHLISGTHLQKLDIPFQPKILIALSCQKRVEI